MKVWIDTLTGTYGDCDGSLVVVDMPESTLEEWDKGVADSTIAVYGLENGSPIVFDEVDNENQYVIYTGILKED